MALDANGRACVIGSGIAGLLAARVLSKWFREVVVLERDSLSAMDGARSGAAQGYHLHALLLRGEQVMERLFPGFEAEMIRLGACKGADACTDAKIFTRAGWARDTHVGFAPLAMTRPLLERCVRSRVTNIANVSIRYATSVDDLVVDVATRRITGVALRSEEAGIDREILPADLVVDATGRGAHGVQMLRSNYFAVPREDVLGLDFGYATALFDIPPSFRAEWGMLAVAPLPPLHSRAALMMKVEQNRWMVALAGRGKSKPVAESAAFMEFVRQLETPFLHECLSHARLVGEIKGYRFPASVHRRYDQIPSHPEGFLAIGDAICSFNPVYGQGMSVAAIEAEILDALLERRGGAYYEGLWRDFHAAASRVISLSWQQAFNVDMMFPETLCPRPFGFALRRRMVQKMQALCMQDPQLRQRFTRMIHLVGTDADKIGMVDLFNAQLRIWQGTSGPGPAPTFRIEAAQHEKVA